MNTQFNPDKINISPQDWAEMLSSAQASKKTKNRRFVAINKENELSIFTNEDLDGKHNIYKKLSVFEISSISKAKIKELEEIYSKKEYISDKDKEKYKDISEKILFFHMGITNSRYQKRYNLENKVKRFFSLIISELISFLFTAPLTGFFYREKDAFNYFGQQKVLKDDYDNMYSKYNPRLNTFNEIITHQKVHLKKIPSILSEMGYDKSVIEGLLKIEDLYPELFIEISSLELQLEKVNEKELQEKLKTTIANLKSKIDEVIALKNEYDISYDNARKFLLIKERIVNKLVPYINSEQYQKKALSCLVKLDEWNEHQIEKMKNGKLFLPSKQFKLDIPRGMTFKRKDKLLNIDDPHSIPRLIKDDTDHAAKEKMAIEESVRALFGLAREDALEKDLPWIDAIQLYVTQTTGNTFGHFPSQLFEASTSPLPGKYLVPRTDEDDMPTEITVIRDPKTHDITRIDVSQKRVYNMVTEKTNIDDQTHREITIVDVIIREALIGEVQYSVTLGKENKPIISNFKLHCSTGVTIP